MAKRHRNPLSRVNKGAGTGVGEHYVSPIHQRDFSGIGKSSLMPHNTSSRRAQTLSTVECRTFAFVDFYPDFVDIREQFMHLPLEESLTLCLSLGINHPTQRGNLFPISTDFLVTRKNGQLLAIEDKFGSAEDLDPRDLEIHLARQTWWKVRDVPCLLVSSSDLCQITFNNILRIQQDCWRYDVDVGIDPVLFADHFRRLHQDAQQLATTFAFLKAEVFPDKSAGTLRRALSKAIKDGHLFVDLRQQIAPIFRLSLVDNIDQSADWPW